MVLYNLFENGLNYADTTSSLWFYFKNEANKFNVGPRDDNASKSFKLQAKLLGKTVVDGADEILRNTKVDCY